MEKELEEVKEQKSEELFDEEQPIVLKLDKKALKGEPRLKAEGDFFDFTGYLVSIKNDLSCIIALAGAILVYLSPYMTWLKQTIRGEVSKADLLDLAGEFGEIALNQKSLMLFGILILIMALAMLILTAREHIRPLRPYADNYLIRIAPSVVTLIMFILILKNKMYVAEVAKTVTETGAGQIFLVVGLVLYTISVVFDFMNRGDKL